jgi:hypothetical protein
MNTDAKKNSKWLSVIMVSVLLAAGLSACEELGMGGDKDYNVYYLPDGNENASVYVGQTKGIRSCRQLANMRRQQMNKLRVDKDYICCVITPQSPCAERKY